MTGWTTCQLRAAFAQQMAATYGHEVPAYNTLVDVAAAVNAQPTSQWRIRSSSTPPKGGRPSTAR